MKKQKQELKKIISQGVHFHHNDSAGKEEVTKATFQISIGAVMGVYAVYKEQKKDGGTTLSRVIGITGVVLIILGMKEFKEIQENKNKHAQEIAKKIKHYCDQNPFSPCNLVLHSQGTDVGERVLRSLSVKYQDRIRVVSLGGMVAVPSELCQYAINFKLNHDPIPGVIGSTLNHISKSIIDGMTRKTCQLWSKTSGTFSHGIDEYLNHPTVQNTLKTLAKHNCFELKNKSVILVGC